MQFAIRIAFTTKTINCFYSSYNDIWGVFKTKANDHFFYLLNALNFPDSILLAFLDFKLSFFVWIFFVSPLRKNFY